MHSVKYGLHCCDSRDLLKFFQDSMTGETKKPVELTITSPPYHNLKNYGSEGQIGYGQDYSLYLKELRQIFSSLYQVTSPTGSLWIVADMIRNNGDIVNLPFDITKEIQSVGWKLRDVIIWEKDKTLPWSRKGQFRKLSEYLLFFSKTNNFKYEIDRIRLPDDLKEWWVKYPERYHPNGKVPSNVWFFPIPVQGSWSKKYLRHFCPFPVGLVERIIQLSSDPGDIVFDPFAGSGVVVATAETLGRRGVGLELNNDYVELFDKKVRREIMTEAHEFLLGQERRQARQNELRGTIEKLRQLKYPKTLVRRLQDKEDLNLQKMGLNSIFVIPKVGPQNSDEYKFLSIDCYLIFSKKVAHNELMDAISRVSARKPLSKFGIEATIHIVRQKSRLKELGNEQFYMYLRGMTYFYDREITLDEWAKESTKPEWKDLFTDGLPPIISAISIRQTIPRTYQRGKSGNQRMAQLLPS